MGAEGMVWLDWRCGAVMLVRVFFGGKVQMLEKFRDARHPFSKTPIRNSL